MLSTNRKITLNDAEIKTAIIEYIENRTSPAAKVVGQIKISVGQSGWQDGSIANKVDADVQDILITANEFEKPEESSYVKLRHRDSNLFLQRLFINENNVIEFQLNKIGLLYQTKKMFFTYFERMCLEANKLKVGKSKFDLSAFKEKLLDFDFVIFEESKIDEMTFHLDLIDQIKS